jgi:hypothetical protein
MGNTALISTSRLTFPDYQPIPLSGTSIPQEYKSVVVDIDTANDSYPEVLFVQEQSFIAGIGWVFTGQNIPLSNGFNYLPLSTIGTRRLIVRKVNRTESATIKLFGIVNDALVRESLDLSPVITAVNQPTVIAPRDSKFCQFSQSSEMIHYVNNGEWKEFNYPVISKPSLASGNRYVCPDTGRYRCKLSIFHWEGQGTKAYEPYLFGGAEPQAYTYLSPGGDYRWTSTTFTTYATAGTQLWWQIIGRSTNMQVRWPTQLFELIESTT